LNQGFTYTEIIDHRGEGRPLLDYLTDRYGHTPKSGWEERIGAGLVLLGDEPARCADVIRKGQRLSWLRPPWEEPEAPLAYGVLFEDEDLLAVAKPSGLPTLPGGGYLENTLLALVRRRHPEASPIHRLGRGTSGVVLFARTAASGRTLCRALREQQMIKIYRALVQGLPSRDAFSVAVPIGPVIHPGLGTVHAASPQGRAALSHVRILEGRESNSLVEVHIETGRPHQIRIHMAACGHPLVGDPLYASGGGFRQDQSALPGDEGYLLHALRLTLPHPRSGLPFAIECQAPRVLRPQTTSPYPGFPQST
jgi:23S rRNA pseudouridine1911/1915/1917 synthase